MSNFLDQQWAVVTEIVELHGGDVISYSARCCIADFDTGVQRDKCNQALLQGKISRPEKVFSCRIIVWA